YNYHCHHSLHDIELLPLSEDFQSRLELDQITSYDVERDDDQRLLNDEVGQSNQKLSILQFEGWKGSMFWAFVASLVVLVFNIGFLLYTAHRKDTVLFKGDCEKVHNISIGFHLLINILGTAVLGASNFGMQCLSAPTRNAVDNAHRQGKWLDIGVHSIRNLLKGPKRHSLLWLCLALSSLPFHMLYYKVDHLIMIGTTLLFTKQQHHGLIQYSLVLGLLHKLIGKTYIPWRGPGACKLMIGKTH
ncbi:hypothetical protein N7495_002620, partial [Penicillium taxi]|uniref:uncharacterized protein n=1 Tax=Penicillium taxi TaxID=168475 RepID=UPI00254532D8